VIQTDFLMVTHWVTQTVTHWVTQTVTHWLKVTDLVTQMHLD